MLKLHLGCGDKHIDGYVNIDIRPMETVDKVDNIKYLRSFKKDSVDVIYSASVLERRWYEILKPGGILRLGVPDFEAIVKYYLETGELDDIMGLLYGGQDYEQNFHYACWDFYKLQKDLYEVGFKNMKRYDWRDTEHSNIDDFSQCYLPHMNKENGMLMHLNVEATK
jgi:predicted SAM-dependent methyltransferase